MLCELERPREGKRYQFFLWLTGGVRSLSPHLLALSHSTSFVFRLGRLFLERV